MTPSKKDSLTKKTQDGDEKIRSLQEMIATAERTITSAKQMLSQIQTENDLGNVSTPPKADQDGQIVLGSFDGQIMIGEDGKQYPVPANYSSKSKLVEGDMLKLTITNEGSFVYKQIGPTERRYLIGIVKQDERGNLAIKTEDKTYKVLLAATTYFKIELGDEVTIIVPRDKESVWGAIENVVKKATDITLEQQTTDTPADTPKEEKVDDEIKSEEQAPKRPTAIERLEKEMEQERKTQVSKENIVDEWIPDIEELKKEAGHPVGARAEEE